MTHYMDTKYTQYLKIHLTASLDHFYHQTVYYKMTIRTVHIRPKNTDQYNTHPQYVLYITHCYSRSTPHIVMASPTLFAYMQRHYVKNPVHYNSRLLYNIITPPETLNLHVHFFEIHKFATL
jgi:hypothetical protein